MAEMYLVTLSEAKTNYSRLKLQRWMLDGISNCSQYLSNVSCSRVEENTWDKQLKLIKKVSRLFALTGGDFHGINELLEAKTKEVEAEIPADELDRMNANSEQRETYLQDESIEAEKFFFEITPDLPLWEMQAKRFIKR